ncbi:4'-phosphopantetheinyl transferase family protein [Lysinibacillus sp. NPDC059133]|uniref:4'-phosphopantetheinyl transferase family protein n=1 Tax=Lysinibacillus sp. NPDC059133 TaxID=3346737 RepID=UPI0036CC98AA
MVEIYAVKIPEYITGLQFSRLTQYVDLQKKERIKRFVKVEDAYRTLIADILLRSLICEKFGIINHDIIFNVTEYGKPYLKNVEQLSYNISHSGDWVVIALNNFEIGIDIEMIKPIDFNFAKQFLTEYEYFDLMSIQEKRKRLEYFYDLWTLKESYVKAIGKGLFFPLKDFTIQKDSLNKITFQSSLDTNSWYFKQYEVDHDYKLSVCSEINSFPNFPIIKKFSNLCQEIENY